MATSDQNGSNVPRGTKLSDTERKQRQTRGLIPFKKGDPRINRNGRPKSFDALREIAQEIAHEELQLGDGRKIMVAEAVLRAWAKSKEPQLQKAFIEYAFGKVPDKLETTGLESKPVLILHYAHERQKADQN